MKVQAEGTTQVCMVNWNWQKGSFLPFKCKKASRNGSVHQKPALLQVGQVPNTQNGSIENQNHTGIGVVCT